MSLVTSAPANPGARCELDFGCCEALLDTYNLSALPRLHDVVRTPVQFARLFLTSAPVLFVLWLIFVGSFSWQELLVGVGASLLGGVAICVLQRADPSHFRPRLGDVLQIGYVPWMLLQGTHEIMVVSLRDLFGGRKAASLFRVVTFEAGEVCEPHDTARRVFAVAYTTMAPNFIVLGINTPEQQLLFHQIERTDVPAMTKNLGAAG